MRLVCALAVLLAAATLPASAQSLSASVSGDNLRGDTLRGDNRAGDSLRGNLFGGDALFGNISGRSRYNGDTTSDSVGGGPDGGGIGTFSGTSAFSGSLHSGERSTLSASQPLSYYGNSAFAGSLASGQQSPNPNAPISYGR